MLSRDEMARADLAGLVQRLREPPITVGLQELAELWTFETFRFTCTRPVDMEDYPELAERVRGAFGAALHRQAEPRTLTGRIRAHPYDVLFSQLPQDIEEMAKPIVIRAWLEGRHLVVELRVFGTAIAWRDEAANAMLDALQQGIAIRGAPRALRIPVATERMDHGRVSFVDVPRATQGLIRFRSPFTVRRNGVRHAAPEAVLPAMLGRIERMAPWQACLLQFSNTRIRAAIDGASLDVMRWDRVSWQRHTRNRGDIAVPMLGWVGEIRLQGVTEELAVVLALAETCNAGSHAALGMGWFEWLPG
ncbi:MAG: CRISPR system precrRNA processing endoribonuclease RAMP protein Cas6 [Brevundimonas sp.]|uniref:CRISPR system precrRNA processing endoribonuclease RAMP protein Cas6 n=1 Tax=Brevundimonas sp. TaxID=1871086 RepID=UPI00391F9DEC